MAFINTGAQLQAAIDALPASKKGNFVAFDAKYYAETYLGNYQGTLTPIEHFAQIGSARMYNPSALFEPTVYRGSYSDLAGLDAADLLVHYLKFGLDEGRIGSSALFGFDGARYLRDNADVSTYVNANLSQFGGSVNNGALAHFVKFGSFEHRFAYDTAGNPLSINEAPATSAIATVDLDGNTTKESLWLNTNGGESLLVKGAATFDGKDLGGVLRLAGDADVVIDLADPAKVIREIDLNGDGKITANGVENNVAGAGILTASNFTIIDAYPRNPLNELDTVSNFSGDIVLKGEGFDGDGVKTDGNIFLGGLGNDFALTGIGNDFLAGGGGANNVDRLQAGRNADFIFYEMGRFDRVDGNSISLMDGGSTADDNSAGTTQSPQDNDWLLFEATDDDEPVTIRLEDALADEDGDGVFAQDDNDGYVQNRSGVTTTELRDIENVNASGNLYGFIDSINVEMGGRRLDTRDAKIATDVKYYGDTNYGSGTSAQLNIQGSIASNTIIAGYDNDVVSGGAGNDLLFGGDLRFIKTHNNNANLLTITNDGRDELSGGDGDDNLVLELDKGVVAGDAGNDTLWLTDYTVGRTKDTEAATAADRIVDQRIRIDLGYADYRGYRGSTDDARNLRREGTADQTNYVGDSAPTKASGGTTITGLENVIAGGLGDIDYKAAGANSPELGFTNVQNYQGSNVNMDLRGTDGYKITFVPTGTITATTPADLTALEVASLYADYATAYASAFPAPGVPMLLLPAFRALLTAGGISLSPVNTVTGAPAYTSATVALGNNTLIAGTGNDVLEGRTGDDFLTGHNGNDDFYFFLGSGLTVPVTGGDSAGNGHNGDNTDEIARRVDANGDDIWDVGADSKGVLGRDFGLAPTTTTGVSVLQIKIQKSGGGSPTDQLSDVVSSVTGVNTGVKVNGVFVPLSLASAEISAATTYQQLATALQNAINASAFNGQLTAALQPDGRTIFISDAQGRDLADQSALASAGVGVIQRANTDTGNVFTFSPPAVSVSQDRLIYEAYEDRLDNEGVDDDAVLGSTIALGKDNYAQDLVVGFSADGTRIAEDQQYQLTFTNLTTEDMVTINVNGVKYTLQVGRDIDGTLIPGENSLIASNTQAGIQAAFLARMSTYINTFLDDDTAVGAVNSTATGTTLNLTQRAYDTFMPEEVVFMNKPVVTLENRSGGERASVTVTDLHSHQVYLRDFNGRDGALNAGNVLFVGEEFKRLPADATIDQILAVSRSVLETAKSAGGTLLGDDAMVVYVANQNNNDNITSSALEGLGGKAIVFNTTPNITTQASTNFGSANFSVHGDDLLIGGDGADTIRGGTGDDRVIGSRGTDTLDGGKDLWLQDGVIRVLNDYEAGVEDAKLTTVNLDKIRQTQTGSGLQDGFRDTLLFQQADFGVVGTGGAQFTITLDADLDRKNGGSGTVESFEAGKSTGLTRFTNFENIRTVSGDGTYAGQGRDTLDVVALSKETGGVFYNLSNNTASNAGNQFPNGPLTTVAGPGSVVINFGEDYTSYVDTLKVDVKDTNLENDLAINANDPNVTDPLSNDAVFTVVDGVENVLAGEGDDGVYVDETEAGKDNLFSLGLGNDIVLYGNRFDAAGTTGQVPDVTVIVNSASDTDTVKMTNGRVGLDVASDTLSGVEAISFATDDDNLDHLLGVSGGAAASNRENDTLDVSNVQGATVDYTNAHITSGGLVEEGGVTQVVLYGAGEFETVLGSGQADRFIIANTMVNTRINDALVETVNDDADNTTADISFDSVLNYDFVNDAIDGPTDILVPDDKDIDGQRYDRMSIAELRAVGRTGADINPFGEVNIPEVRNEDFYEFVGGAGSDTVDYSEETGRIIAVVNFNTLDDTLGNPTHVLVDTDGDGSYNDSGDRVDLLRSIENIAAANFAGGGNSTIDLTNAQTGSSVLFSFQYDPNAPIKGRALDQDIEVHTVRITGADITKPLENLNLLEYSVRPANSTQINALAAWTVVEGSDFAEYVQLTGSEDRANRTLNLRGGNNEVNYNERTRGIELFITAIDTAAGDGNTEAINEHLITATAFHLDENGARNGFQDSISSFNNANKIQSASSLRIEASQGDKDLINVGSLGAATYILGVAEANDSVIQVLFNGKNYGMTLSGFETLWDSPNNDVYTVFDLSNFVTTTTLADFNQAGVPLGSLPSTDRDAIKLTNGSFETANIRAPISHSLTISPDLHLGDGNVNDLQWLGLNSLGGNKLGVAGSVGYDFEVLDISEVTTQTGLKATSGGPVGARDEIIIGALGNIDSTATGGFVGFSVLSLTNNTAPSASTFKLNSAVDEFQNASGTRLFRFAGTEVDASRVTAAVTLSVADTAALFDNVSFTGGAGADSLTGGRGADVLRGGAGNDVLDGSFVAAVNEVHTLTLTGTTLDAANNFKLTFGAGVTGTIDEGVEIPTGGADVDQIGAAIAAFDYSNLTFDHDANVLTAEVKGSQLIQSVTYNATSNVVTFTYNNTFTALDSTNYDGSTIDQDALFITVTPDGAANVSIDGTPVNIAGARLPTEANFVPRAESADTYRLEASATLNGLDTIRNFDLSDRLDVDGFTIASDIAAVTGFLTAASVEAGLGDAQATSVTVAGLTGSPTATLADDIVFVNANGTAATSATLAAAFLNDIVTGQKTVVVETDSTRTGEDAQVWFVHDANINGIITADEVNLVGTLTGAGDLLLTAANF